MNAIQSWLLPDSYEKSAASEKKTRYVFWIIALALVIIFLLYRTKVLDQLPCDPTWFQACARNFVHLRIPHLLANLYTFWVLSRIEDVYGSAKYATLIAVIFLTYSTAEFVLAKVGGDGQKCAIGFSGILFGLAAWEIITTRGEFNWALVAGLVAMVVTPSIVSRQASFKAHALGAIIGVVLGFITKAQRQETFKNLFISRAVEE